MYLSAFCLVISTCLITCVPVSNNRPSDDTITFPSGAYSNNGGTTSTPSLGVRRGLTPVPSTRAKGGVTSHTTPGVTTTTSSRDGLGVTRRFTTVPSVTYTTRAKGGNTSHTTPPVTTTISSRDALGVTRRFTTVTYTTRAKVGVTSHTTPPVTTTKSPGFKTQQRVNTVTVRSTVSTPTTSRTTTPLLPMVTDIPVAPCLNNTDFMFPDSMAPQNNSDCLGNRLMFSAPDRGCPEGLMMNSLGKCRRTMNNRRSGR